MIEKTIAEGFLNKQVGVLFLDSDKDFFCKGRLIEVTDYSIVITFQGRRMALALETIKSIREV